MSDFITQVNHFVDTLLARVDRESRDLVRDVGQLVRDEIEADSWRGRGYEGDWKGYSQMWAKVRAAKQLPVDRVTHHFTGDMFRDFQVYPLEDTFDGVQARIGFVTAESRDKAFWNEYIWQRTMLGFSDAAISIAENRLKLAGERLNA